MQQLPPAGTSELFLCRHPKREARQDKLSIRFQTLDIHPHDIRGIKLFDPTQYLKIFQST
jgi:hypothetical protein